MGQKYSKKEILDIKYLIEKYGHMNYHQWAQTHDEYVEMTGVDRDSAALYMAAWRYERGQYDHMI